jgi:molecular chaperone GrpE
VSKKKAEKPEEETVQPAPEPETSEVAEEPGVPATLDELEAERARADENYDRYLRAVAELDNYRKRTRQEMDEFRKYAAEGLVSQLLEVADNLERAVGSAQQEGDLSTLVHGVSLTLRQLIDVLESHGVRAIEAEGRPFDPNLHEALGRVEAEPDMDNVVVEELQRGYTLHGRVLRPAIVKVGMYCQPEPPESAD